MSAMQEAFARLGMNSPRPAEPRQAPIRRVQMKDRLVEDRAAIAAMSDDDLAFEFAAVTENLEAVRLELRLDGEGAVERERDWRVRAERAAAILRGRAGLCRVEMERRRAIVTEQRRLEHQQKLAQAQQNRQAHDERIALAHLRKQENIAASAVRDSGDRDAFIRHARALLPAETFAAIWAAVRAERGPA